MLFFLRQLSFSFLLVVIGVFPYMPLAHAEGNIPHSHHYGCEQSQQGGHEMDLCIQAVHDVLSGTTADVPVISIVPAFIFPFWEHEPDLVGKKDTAYFSHSLDPPSWSSQDLIGIVRILV